MTGSSFQGSDFCFTSDKSVDTQVWQFSPASIDEADLLKFRKLAGFDDTKTLNDRCAVGGNLRFSRWMMENAM